MITIIIFIDSLKNANGFFYQRIIADTNDVNCYDSISLFDLKKNLKNYLTNCLSIVRLTFLVDISDIVTKQ